MIQAVTLYDWQRILSRKRQKRAARFVSRLNIILNGVDIGVNTIIGEHFVIHHGIGLIIGNQVKKGNCFTVFQNVTIGSGSLGLVQKGLEERSPTIGNFVTIYPQSIVDGQNTIGDRSTIGAHCLVMKDVPAGTKLVAGTVWT